MLFLVCFPSAQISLSKVGKCYTLLFSSSFNSAVAKLHSQDQVWKLHLLIVDLYHADTLKYAVTGFFQSVERRLFPGIRVSPIALGKCEPFHGGFQKGGQCCALFHLVKALHMSFLAELKSTTWALQLVWPSNISIYVVTFKVSLFELNPVETIAVPGVCIVVSLGISSQKIAPCS